VKLAKKNEGILVLLMALPWWVSVIVSSITFFMLAGVLPAISFESVLFQGLANGASKLAFIMAIVLLIPAPISAFNSWRKRKLFKQQESLDTIKKLSWKEFEELVAEVYRRKGFKVIENNQGGADGGVDVRLEKEGRKYLVQCKQWKNQKIGVAVIREMYGIMTAEKAEGVIVICSGKYTQDAEKFAQDKPIELIEGSKLFELIAMLKANEGDVKKEVPQDTSENILEPQKSKCPKCGSELLLRVAKKGPKEGNEFYGCSSFPKCRHTQPC
jgi:restriction system protein